MINDQQWTDEVNLIKIKEEMKPESSFREPLANYSYNQVQNILTKFWSNLLLVGDLPTK